MYKLGKSSWVLLAALECFQNARIRSFPGCFCLMDAQYPTDSMANIKQQCMIYTLTLLMLSQTCPRTRHIKTPGHNKDAAEFLVNSPLTRDEDVLFFNLSNQRGISTYRYSLHQFNTSYASAKFQFCTRFKMRFQSQSEARDNLQPSVSRRRLLRISVFNSRYRPGDVLLKVFATL